MSIEFSVVVADRRVQSRRQSSQLRLATSPAGRPCSCSFASVMHGTELHLHAGPGPAGQGTPLPGKGQVMRDQAEADTRRLVWCGVVWRGIISLITALHIVTS
jgi:hypothetical protein